MATSKITSVAATSKTTSHSADYLPRRLASMSETASESIDEHGLLRKSGGAVVLGEPGMGKSELMRELARRSGAPVITAKRFAGHKNPAMLVTPGAPLLIDALDEAIARREGDAIDAVLSQLEAAGCPDFVLSCRSREWQARGVHSLAEAYGREPKVYSLEAFNRTEASAYLAARYPRVDPAAVLGHLDKHGLEELHGNPLTLGLMGRVAEADRTLPTTRGALFERVCELLWPEHDDDRQYETLGQLTQADALSAAGAICAALILAGAEIASLAGAAQLAEGDLRIAEIERLPGASHARAAFSTKLFQSVGIGRGKPIHRVVAEFLGARWLASQATTPRSERRLLQQFHGGGSVPASLRGLHAWLGYHGPALAERVIAADPYGVLRYGETSTLTPSQAECLFAALEALAADDPFFRANEWDARTAAGLMIPELADRIAAAIASRETNEHLRSLLVETLQGSKLAARLGSELEAILLSPRRFFREREAAAEALYPHRSAAWWRATIETLRHEGGEDAPRLMRGMMCKIAFDVSDGLIVETIFAEAGLLYRAIPRSAEPRVHTVRTYSSVFTDLPDDRICGVLDQIAEFAEMSFSSDWQAANDISDLASRLMARAIDGGLVTAEDGARLWRWLGLYEHAGRYHRSPKDEVETRLRQHVDLRRAAQAHGLYRERGKETIWAAQIDLLHRSISLSAHDGDALFFLERMAGGDRSDEALREDWQDLARIAGSRDGMAAARCAGAGFMGDDKRLAAFLEKLEKRKTPSWLLRSQREDAKRARKDKIERETHRRYYLANREGLRAGNLQQILDPAQAYLGFFEGATRTGDGLARLEEWLGPEFVADVQAGFAAALHRSDLPTIAEIGESFAKGATYNYAFVIVAALNEWHRGREPADLPPEILTKGLLLLDHSSGWGSDVDFAPLQAALERHVLPDDEAREAFARVHTEPGLRRGGDYVGGLHKLRHEEAWLAIGGKLAAEWLVTFPDLPVTVEPDLIDCVLLTGDRDALAAIARERAASVYRDYEHMLIWLAVDVIVRFDEVAASISGIGADDPEFLFFLRSRLHHERRSGSDLLSVAQIEWIITEFRMVWPRTSLTGGNSTPYNATEFLFGLIGRLANDSGLEAAAAMSRLRSAPEDSYSDYIRHMAAEQRQKRAEATFSPLLPDRLGALFGDGPPSNAEDLKALVVEELYVAQTVIFGDDLDQVRDFWDSKGVPFGENRCRDRLAAIIGPQLARYGVQRITEADMPADKRADLAFASGALQLPMEVKGQWHQEVWDAASGQLDARYLLDWRSEERGIYCVLWFGELPSNSGRRLKVPPGGQAAPATAMEMRDMLVARIPEARRPLIEVIVLDCESGRRLLPMSQPAASTPAIQSG